MAESLKGSMVMSSGWRRNPDTWSKGRKGKGPRVALTKKNYDQLVSGFNAAIRAMIQAGYEAVDPAIVDEGKYTTGMTRGAFERPAKKFRVTGDAAHPEPTGKYINQWTDIEGQVHYHSLRGPWQGARQGATSLTFNYGGQHRLIMTVDYEVKIYQWALRDDDNEILDTMKETFTSVYLDNVERIFGSSDFVLPVGEDE